MTHICVSRLNIIGSDNGLPPGRRQAIIWTNAGLLLTGPLATNFSEILIEIIIFSFNKMRLKVSSAKWRPFCPGLNVLKESRPSAGHVQATCIDTYIARSQYKVLSHDDVIKWKHFPRYWPFVRGIHRSPVNSHHKGQWRGALDFLWSVPVEQIIETPSI